MTSKELRDYCAAKITDLSDVNFKEHVIKLLAEIAAQIAEINEDGIPMEPKE